MARSGILIAVLLLAACGSQPKREDLFVAELAAMLPGSYDNLAQSRQDPGHPALRLVVAPVQAPLVGSNVYYVQEMAADDPRRVFSQRLFVLEAVAGGTKAVLLQADFAEGTRWRDGHLNLDLFRSLLPQDLRARAGCDIVIERQGSAYTGTGGSNCRIAAPGSGETLKVEQGLKLDRDGLALLEQQRDASGALVRGGGNDAWHRYARRADAPW